MKRITKVFILALIVIMLFGTVSSFASEPYDTYTYSIDGEPLSSPAAYSAMEDFDAADMKLYDAEGNVSDLKDVSDIVSDEQANLYIADKGNNRIVVLNKFYEAVATISSYEDEYGRTQTLKEPQGLYVTNPDKTVDGESYIYVCDTGNLRVVIFDRNYKYVRTIEKPDSPILTEGAFKPCSIAVDIYGRIFIVSTASHEGVIVLSGEGDFTGFIGAQKVTYSLMQMIWRRFQTKEQREKQTLNIATAYNNITVDDSGFVYVTSNTTDPALMQKQQAAIEAKTATYSPVKKLNSQGVEIMKRNGFFDPGGEVVRKAEAVSQIVDVAIGKEGSWTILDQSRSRFFTYDLSGNLLFAFGDQGDQLGNGVKFNAITYQVIKTPKEDAEITEDDDELLYDTEYRLVALDIDARKITVYTPTKYYDTIMSALRNQNDHEYSQSIIYWQEVLTQNNNFDLAYIGIGKALYNQGKYEEAMEKLAKAYETENYAMAFKELRTRIISKWILLFVVLIIAAVILLFKFLGYAKKKNKAVSLKVGRKTYWEELLYAFHLVFHPFDGFWDLKHEKRGSVRAASTIILIAMLAFFYNAIGKGYTFNPRGDLSNVFLQVLAIGVPFILFCVANWCLTTLFDGEGGFKDIYIAAGYSLAPLAPFVIVSTILTNIVTAESSAIVTMITTIGVVWMAFLLFFGTLVTHDYSLGKNFVTILGTVVAMAIIMFVIILFSSLVVKMIMFIVTIISEIGNRI